MDFSNRYIIGFSIILCLVSALGVSSLAVSLKEKQDVNKLLDKRANILRVAGLIEPGAKVTPEEADDYFESIATLAISRESGEVIEDLDAESLEPAIEAKDPATSVPTPAEHKLTQLARLPEHLVVYRIDTPGKEGFVIPIWGNGLWSTLYGFLSLSQDLSEVRGITYYEHGETPGLGGEVDNPAWKALWVGKRAFDDNFEPAVTVVKAGALTVGKEDVQVDGLSGATITTKGVDAMVQLWLSSDGYGKFFDRVRNGDA